MQEKNPRFVGYQPSKLSNQNQSVRLLGSNYWIAQERRLGRGVEITAVRKDVGKILHIADSAVDDNIAESYPTKKDCNDDFTISKVDIQIENMRFALVNAHPESSHPTCRAFQLKQLFLGASRQNPLLKPGQKAIIAGDFNFDPYRSKDGQDLQIWNRFVGYLGDEKPFYYHSGKVEHDPPYFTSHHTFKRRTLDHIVTNFATGKCQTLGEAPETRRLDGGTGTDHRALLVDLVIPQ